MLEEKLLSLINDLGIILDHFWVIQFKKFDQFCVPHPLLSSKIYKNLQTRGKF